MDQDRNGFDRSDFPDDEEFIDSELQLVRTLDRTLKNRYPEGVSLMRTVEGGSVLELHRQIQQPFSPHACGKAGELTEYLWLVGRTVTLEPGGGITVSGGGSTEKFVVGRTFYREVEVEYRMIHTMILDALSLKL